MNFLHFVAFLISSSIADVFDRAPADACHANDPQCDDTRRRDSCWGYEADCAPNDRHFTDTHCDDAKKRDRFWRDADFGYVRTFVEQMRDVCSPTEEASSHLRCDHHMRICVARNIYMDMRDFQLGSDSFREDVFPAGANLLGGRCRHRDANHPKEGEHRGPLWSWMAELRAFESLDFDVFHSENDSANEARCDRVEETPTIFVKLDATVNMYHHFCDFFNLYASMHANATTFSKDVQIVVWDARMPRCRDALFGVTWSAFSDWPRKMLVDFAGARVCFRNVMFALLPRMRHGLYYSTYIVPGCRGSGLFWAFARFILNRLGVEQTRANYSRNSRLRLTFLTRSTAYRRILNLDELVDGLRGTGLYDVNVVDYNRDVDFVDQLNATYNSDIFIGMHGAGLTHLLFLPDWATVFELFHCHDPRCYSDLARLRGVDYVTWIDENKLEIVDQSVEHEGNAKFANFRFDLTEFLKLVGEARESVMRKFEGMR